jgi:hypothetical protein
MIESNHAAPTEQLWALWRLLLSALLEELQSDKPRRAQVLAITAAFLKDNGIVIDLDSHNPALVREKAIANLALILPFGGDKPQ